MALNSSGPISLGGTTAGVSIEKELGGSGTAMISLNDANVRSLAGVSSGAITMPTNFWGKSTGYYLMGAAVWQSSSETFYGMAVGTNTIYLSSAQFKSGTTPTGGYVAVTPVNSNATFGSNFGSQPSTGIGVNDVGYNSNILVHPTNGNIIYSMTCSSSYIGSGYTVVLMSSSTPSGTINSRVQYYFRYSGFNYASTNANVIIADNSGYVYLIGYLGATNGGCYCPQVNYLFIARYDSSLSLNTSQLWSNGSNNLYGFCGAYGSDNKLYLGGEFNNGSGQPISGQFTASLSINYLVTFNLNGYFVNGINADSNGNMISAINNNTYIVIISSNSTGSSINWAQRTQQNSGSARQIGVGIDSSNNVYISNYNNTQGAIYVTKFNSSGTVQWQRIIRQTLSGSALQSGSTQLKIVGSQIFISSAGSPGGSAGAYFFVLPTDGSKTGTYTITSGITGISYLDPVPLGTAMGWVSGSYTISTFSSYSSSGSANYSSNSSYGGNSTPALSYSGAITI